MHRMLRKLFVRLLLPLLMLAGCMGAAGAEEEA